MKIIAIDTDGRFRDSVDLDKTTWWYVNDKMYNIEQVDIHVTDKYKVKYLLAMKGNKTQRVSNAEFDGSRVRKNDTIRMAQNKICIDMWFNDDYLFSLQMEETECK